MSAERREAAYLLYGSKFRPIFAVGFCNSYGDGDYRVSGEIQSLTVQQMKDLRAALIGAIYQAEEMWRNRPNQEMAAQATILPEENTILKAATEAKERMAGWSESKRDFADRVVNPGRPLPEENSK